MTEPLESAAQAYLLGELDPARREAFERELARDPAARAALKACADSFAAFACEAAPAVPLPPADQARALHAILAAAQPAPAPASRPDFVRTLWPWVWPAAAVLLLAINFLDFPRPFTPASSHRAPAVPSTSSPNPAAGTPAPRTGESANPAEDRAPAAAHPGSAAPVASSNRADPATEELKRTRTELEDLRRAQARLRADYDAVFARFLDHAAAEKTLGRFNTMELVDAVDYAQGQRRGLGEIARAVLTEPGVVVAHEPPPVESSSAITPTRPYAWAVFDQVEQRGYLNLYQLPTASAGETMQIWVRPVDTKDFVRVGEVPPQFYGGNGTVQYAMRDPGTAPAEILVTLEPRGTAPAAPSGPVVLRGP